MLKTATLERVRMFDLILERICVALQLTQSQFDDAQEKYKSVCSWLSREGNPLALLQPFLHPQGSLKTDTTVRPVGQAEFDLDLVCLLQIRRRIDPAAVYEMIWDRMHSNATYRKIIERKPRCIRINYAGQFHLDVVPAIPDWSQRGTCIFIPDIAMPDLQTWKASNPLGYATWLELMANKKPSARKFAANESYAPLLSPKPAHLKLPQRLAIQLFKRWRDLAFARAPSLAPPSIVITTLAGLYYDGEEEYSHALGSILDKIVALADQRRIVLYNPVNPQELLTERWRDIAGSYDMFVDKLRDFRDCWADLVHSQGLPNIAAELKRLFGEPVDQAIKEAAAPITTARHDNRLYVAKGSGTLLAATSAPAIVPSFAVKVRGNDFYGN